MSDRAAGVLLFGLALAAALLLLVTTTFMTPVSNDAGAYLAVADAVLAGKLPYRDIFDHKTPGIYYSFAGVLALSGAIGQLRTHNTKARDQFRTGVPPSHSNAK